MFSVWIGSMPELPEAETIVRDLSPKIGGLRIESSELLYPPLLKDAAKHPVDEIIGKRILSVNRRGKMILLDCSDGLTLLFHLKMTGRLLFCSRSSPRDKHLHFILRFEGVKSELRFRDIRKFGYIRCLPTQDACLTGGLPRLGPEPLDIDLNSFSRIFRGRRARIKGLLLDQSFIAGIGNIYADEILHRARIHPAIPASELDGKKRRTLWRAMRAVLSNAIESRGTSIQDYADTEGRRGRFQNFLQVYGREGGSCRICGERIERLRLGGRSTFFCPCCQSRKR